MALRLSEIFELESENKFVEELKIAMKEGLLNITLLDDICKSVNKKHIFSDDKYDFFSKEKEILKNSSYNVHQYDNFDSYQKRCVDEYFSKELKRIIGKKVESWIFNKEYIYLHKVNSNYVLYIYIKEIYNSKYVISEQDKTSYPFGITGIYGEFSNPEACMNSLYEKNNYIFYKLTDEKDIFEFMNNFVNDCLELYKLKKKSHSILDDFFGNNNK